ncbi:MAG TPA: SIS domain-containing protein [Candidatus Limiplasma sp.]|nr:SIS domain-containing protein [Candidatus Limiplasma sp.]
MKNKMQDYIAIQPQVLAGVLAQTDFRELQDKAHAFTRIVLVGAGSSYHAMHMACPFCRQALNPATVIACTPAQLDWLTPAMAAETLVIVASQSGTSTNVLGLIERLQKEGFFVCAVTQDASSPIATGADAHVLLTMPTENAGPKTMGVMATMLTVQLLACVLGGSGEAKLRKDMARIIAAMPRNIEATVRWCGQAAPELMQTDAYLVVGQDNAAAIAGESVLKLIETVRRPSIGLELEEIIHGPVNVFQKGITLLYLSRPDEAQTRPQALRDMAKAAGAKAWNIALHQGEPANTDDTLTLTFDADPLLCAYALLLPAQIISAYVAPAMGIDLDAHHADPYSAILAGHL